MDDTELSTLARRYIDLKAQRADLDAALGFIATQIRNEYPVGTKRETPDGLRVSIRANRRFNPDRAAETLEPDLLAAVSEWTVSSQLAKATLPPPLYEACMSDRGEPVVDIRLAES